MATASFHELSADLDGLISAVDRRLSTSGGPSAVVGGAMGPFARPSVRSVRGSEAGSVERQLVASTARCSRLIEVVRSVRFSIGPVGVTPAVPVPQIDPVGAEGHLAVAPLSVPDRILKRYYNYFDTLNADLRILAEKQKKDAAEALLKSSY